MRLVLLLSGLLVLILCLALGQTSDVLGMHNLSVASGASVYSQGSLGCTFCHAPHSGLGGVTPLWNQTLSKSTYTPYNSTTYVEKGNTPANAWSD